MDDLEIDSWARGRLGSTLRGKYRLDAVIGVGGMATVYRATHRNRAQFAVKLLHPDFSQNKDVRTRFLREGYAANSVQHPGAVLVTDDDVAEDGSAFLVMELLDGVSVDVLRARLGPKLPLPVAVSITLQLLDVLAAAHTAGVVHRDIKPANVFVTREGVVKVLDFGIARVLDQAAGSASATGAGMPMGTPSFMAPEQALGRSADIGPRTDVWATGATLFALLSGETVHTAPTAATAIVYAATRAARPLSEVAREVPTSVAEVVDRALAFEPADRWGSAREMSEALSAATNVVATGLGARAVLAELLVGTVRSVSLAPSAQPVHSELATAPTVSASELPSCDDVGSDDTALPIASTQRVPVGHWRAQRWGRWLAGAGVVALAAAAAGVWRHEKHRTTSGPPAGLASVAPPPASGGVTLVVITGSQNLTGEPVLDETTEVIVLSALRRSPTIHPFGGPSMRGLVNELAPGMVGKDDGDRSPDCTEAAAASGNDPPGGGPRWRRVRHLARGEGRCHRRPAC